MGRVLGRRGEAALGKISRKSSARLAFEALESRLVLDSTVVFNEIMYHPAGDGQSLEWVELHSQMAVDIDISGWSLQGGVDFLFPEGTVAPGGGKLVVAASPTALKAETGFAGALGPFTGRLANSGEELRLVNNSGRLMDAVDYGDDGDWPVAPDGGGVSLAKIDPDSASGPDENWTFSSVIGGTPGTANAIRRDSLVPFDSVWSFDQSGEDLGVAWRDPDFDDSGWTTGDGLFFVTEAELPRPKNTPLSWGPITYYFRTAFDFSGNPADVQLTLAHVIDDGAVFYLNGVEVDRFNMPEGAVTFETPAASTVRVIEHHGPVTIPTEHLVVGVNTLAVEVHQRRASSPDIVFGLELSATTPALDRAPLVFNEVAPADAAEFIVELTNGGAAPIDLADYLLASSDGADRAYTFSSRTLEPGDFLTLSEAVLGFKPAADDKLFLYTPGKGAIADAVVVTGALRGRFPEATGEWFLPAQPTFGQANQFGFHDEIVINEIMFHPRPTQAGARTLLPLDATWKFDQSDADLGAAWRAAAFDDSGWGQGEGVFLGGTANLPAPQNTPLEPGATTYYFRTAFDFFGERSAIELNLRPIVDDGALFYLNGVEVLRWNMPDGEITHATLAKSTVRTADFEGPFVISTEHLVQGANTLAVEVHQRTVGNSDVVFGLELSEAVEFGESRAAWLEITNRGPAPVDLTGWRIERGIDYAFEAGAVLGPGEYLVVARDPEHLRSLYPGVDIVGPFSGRLSHRDDLLVLVDAQGNPADRVHYFDGGRWGEFADGGGSSLELRDPNADNSVAEAWSTSVEVDNSAWKTYTYRGLASPPPGSNNPANFQEFVLGLLDAGEILLDDVSVVESPDGAAVELIQNGTFSSGAAAWRILGSHQGAIVADPDNPGNQVLRLSASGATEHMHNHAETTLADGATIVNGREYEISFRAKWLAGSNQLHTRLFFNRLAQTTLLEVPPLGGTPGARNSRFEENIGPVYGDFRHGPVVPAAGEPVSVSVRTADSDDVQSMVLWWSTDARRWNSTPMTRAADGRHEGDIPGQAAGTIVSFYVEGTDSLGAVSTFPTGGRQSRALYQVDDGKATDGPHHNFRLIITADDLNQMFEPTNALSNERAGATVIFNEDLVYYNVGARFKGSGFSRGSGSTGFNILFDPEDLFLGVHEKVAIDRTGGPFGIGASHRELVLKHIATRAGGIPGMYDDLIQFILPRAGFTGSAQLLTARYDDVFLDGQFANGADGTRYKLELIYYSTGTVDGDPQSPKRRPSAVLGVDIRDMGDDKEAYRWNYLIKNNRARDDYSRIIELGKTLSLSGSTQGGELDLRSRAVMDVDQWMRVFAFESLVGVNDTYNQGLPHNLQLYVRPEDGRVLALPWDMDFAFHHSTSTPLFGTGSNLRKVVDIPANKRLFYGHLQDIITTSYNTDYLAEWVDHYRDFSAVNFTADILNYVNARRGFVLQRLPTEIPFQITTGGGAAHSVDDVVATIRGDGWINVREIWLAGDDAPLDVTWTDQNSWQVTAPVAFGANELVFEAYDFQGRRIASDSIVVTSTVGERPLIDFLRITEIMYHPAEPSAQEVAAGFNEDSDFEFIELTNIGPDPLPLNGVVFTEGINYDFSSAALTTLAPGEHVLVVRNEAAFAFRYGATQPVAGQFSGKLDNGGENIRLEDPFGAMILDFRYDDAWQPSTDGSGRSLVIRDAGGARASWGEMASWRPSVQFGGSPGAADVSPVLRIPGDANGDRRVDLADLNAVRNNFGAAGPADGTLPGDTTPFDGMVDLADLNAVRNNFGAAGEGEPLMAVERATLLAPVPVGKASPTAGPCTSVEVGVFTPGIIASIAAPLKCDGLASQAVDTLASANSSSIATTVDELPPAPLPQDPPSPAAPSFYGAMTGNLARALNTAAKDRPALTVSGERWVFTPAAHSSEHAALRQRASRGRAHPPPHPWDEALLKLLAEEKSSADVPSKK